MMDESTTAEIETGETTIFAYLRALARVRAADPLVARLSADTLDVAKRRAAACSSAPIFAATGAAAGAWYLVRRRIWTNRALAGVERRCAGTPARCRPFFRGRGSRANRRSSEPLLRRRVMGRAAASITCWRYFQLF